MQTVSMHRYQALALASHANDIYSVGLYVRKQRCTPRPCPLGSGNKKSVQVGSWAVHPITIARAIAAEEPGLTKGVAAAPHQTDPTHSVDTYDDLGGGGYEGADAADLPLCPPDSPLCEDPSHSLDNTDILDWADTPNQGWGGTGKTAAKACWSGKGGSASSSSSSRPWGGSVPRSALLPASYSAAGSSAAAVRAVAAAAGGSTGGGSSSANSGEQQRRQRRQLEQLLLSMVVHGDPGRHHGAVDTSYVVNIDDAPPDEDVTGYEGADAVRLLYPQLDPCRSYDEYEVIDWSDVPNDGWGNSKSSNGSSAPRCRGTTIATSSSSATAHTWGSSVRVSSWLPRHACGSSRVQLRAVAACAAGEAARSGPTHSVDTYDDLGGGGYEGADAADLPLCPPDSPLCEDPSHSLDNTDILDWADTPNQGWGQKQKSNTGQPGSSSSTSSTAAAVDPSYRQKLPTDGKMVKERRPYMNIVNGRWVPPSREQSEHMMRQSYDMGPDEGV